MKLILKSRTGIDESYRNIKCLKKGEIIIINNIIKDVVESKGVIIKQGNLDEKIILELKMITSLYEYIEVITNYYDEEERPDFNNWTDVEGMGYGWRWLNYEEDQWHEMMCKVVSDECDSLIRVLDKTYYLVYKQADRLIYHFIISDEYREDIIITFSNNEMDF